MDNRTHTQRIVDQLIARVGNLGEKYPVDALRCKGLTGVTRARVAQAMAELEGISPTLYSAGFQAVALGVSEGLVSNLIAEGREIIR